MLNKAQKEVQNEIFMGVSIALLLVFTAVVIVAVCFYIAKPTSLNTINAEASSNSRFETIETRMITASVSYTIVYDKQTKVIYSIDSTGKFTSLIDENGDPLIYKGE